SFSPCSHVEGKYGSRNLESLPPDIFSDLPLLTFLHLGNHHHLANIPAFDGTPRLRSLTLAILLSLVELPSFKNLQWLEAMAFPHIAQVVALPDMAPLRSLSRFAVFRPNHLCCDGFLGVCDLEDAFCLPDPIFGLPAASCLAPGDPRHATAATLQVFKRFAAAVCQKSSIPFALEALSDFPSPDRIASCAGVLFRQCEIPGVTSANGTLGMCYSSRMQVVACNVDQLFIQVRRLQIQRKVGLVQLTCFSGSLLESLDSESVVLRVHRRHRKCLGRAPLDITLDRRVHPVRLLPVSTRDVRKLVFGVEFGWRSRRIWFRAPNPEVYEQWGTALRAALLSFGSSHGGGGPAMASDGEHSEVSTVMTTTPHCDDGERTSGDSYTREGSSDSFRSEIPDDEWSDEDRPEIYELHHSEILEFASTKHSNQDDRVYGGKGGARKERARGASYWNESRDCSRRNAVDRSARFLSAHP
ncbi:hypothetical protein BBJ28_00021346, partial [Nothophytophthora sp. Chile5]